VDTLTCVTVQLICVIGQRTLVRAAGIVPGRAGECGRIAGVTTDSATTTLYARALQSNAADPGRCIVPWGA
jgi:hypothetical protein